MAGGVGVRPGVLADTVMTLKYQRRRFVYAVTVENLWLFKWRCTV